VSELMCEVCKKRVAEGIGCVPGADYVAPYCMQCSEAGAHPYLVVVAYTAKHGELSKCEKWWCVVVENTCKYLGVSKSKFSSDVKEQVKKLKGD
jgi:hypothetical protein